jgi:hypothetical protein
VVLVLKRSDFDPVDPERAQGLLANGIACVEDDFLLERMASFHWTNSVVVNPEPFPEAVPTNRFERAVAAFWHTVLGAEAVEVSEQDARTLYFILEDALKEIGRVRGGELSALLRESIWAKLRDALRPVVSVVS